MLTAQLSILAAAATGTAPAEPPAYLQFLPLVLMGLIIWFLILRPQMKRQKAHVAKLGALKKGDRVVTAGGLLGKVVRIDDNYVDLELAPNVKVTALKATIGDIVPPTTPGAANE